MSGRVLTFTVHGTAQPKGSARAFLPKGTTRPIITTDNKSLKAWEGVVRAELQRVMDGAGDQTLFLQLFDAAIRITFVFHLPRPQKPKHRLPITKPDLDKLARGTIDALTGVVFRDDSRVVAIDARKVYAATAAKVDIRIEAIDDIELQPVEAGTLWEAGNETVEA